MERQSPTLESEQAAVAIAVKRLREAVEPVYDQFKDQIGEDLIKTVQDAVAAMENN